MASAITASMFARGFGLSIRHPRWLCRVAGHNLFKLAPLLGEEVADAVG